MSAIYTLLTLPVIMTFVVLGPQIIGGSHDNEKPRYSPLVRHAAVPPPVFIELVEVVDEGRIGLIPQPTPTASLVTPTPLVSSVSPPPPRPVPLTVQTPSAQGRTYEEFARKTVPVVSCESGSNYATNTGNGYYGAWQFDLPTWRSVGGTGMPHHASVEEQNARAYALYLARGWTPWPVCGQRG